jgi:hypothetical protein
MADDTADGTGLTDGPAAPEQPAPQPQDAAGGDVPETAQGGGGYATRFILILIIVLAAASFAAYMTGPSPPQISNIIPTTKPAPSLPVEYGLLNCEDLSKRPRWWFKVSCYTAAAMKAGDVNICSRIVDTGEVPRAYAVDVCRLMYAHQTGDESACDGMLAADDGMYRQCIISGREDAGECMKAAAGKKGPCFMFAAIKLGDPAFCANLTQLGGECMGHVAFRLGNSSLCSAYPRDPKGCEATYSADQALFGDNVGVSAHICGSMTPEEKRNTCMKAMAVFTGDERVCNRLESSKRPGCIEEIAASGFKPIYPYGVMPNSNFAPPR